MQTVDFFTPIVDSAYWFGQLAAANALSDVYAMGARPLTAMNLVAWPSDLDMRLLAEVLKGGAEKVIEAGADLAGGHSIDDKEPKYGLAVTGVARPDEIVYNGGAEPGDLLVITKRLGIGVLASALKKGIVTEDEMMPAIEEAAVLNAAAAEAMAEVGVHACTDVTGFGLLGHLGEMLDASAAAAEVDVAAVPLHDGVLELIEQAVYAGGLRNNRDFLVPRLRAAGDDADAPAGGGPLRRPGHRRRTRGCSRCSTRRPRAGCSWRCRPRSTQALLAALAARHVPGWTVGRVTGGRGRGPSPCACDVGRDAAPGMSRS